MGVVLGIPDTMKILWFNKGFEKGDIGSSEYTHDSLPDFPLASVSPFSL